jgi:TolB-like protein
MSLNTRVTPPPDPRAIREALERIVATALQGSPQLARFLTFVVGEALAGRGEQLKEHTIAVGAFGQAPTFDPATDARVRVAARQLRFKLAEYYGGAGAHDAIVIELPKGRYVPAFSARVPAPAQAAEPTRHVDGDPAPVPRSPAWQRWGSLGAAVAAALTLGWAAIAPTPPAASPSARAADGRAAPVSRPGDAPAGNVVVVLPFVNVTGREAEEYIGDGLTEEIMSRLATDTLTRVVARTSAWSYKGKQVDVREIGKALGADYVIEGSVRRSGSRYRVSVDLVSSRDGLRLWSRPFEVERQSVFGLYDAIAQAVHDELSLRLAASPGMLLARQAPRDPVVHDLYLEARYFWNQRTTESLPRAVARLREAIRRDSTFAAGWAALAGVYATMEVNHHTDPGVSAPRALDAAHRALALDASLGEAWTAIGLVTSFSQWKWAEADSAFRRGIALSPGSATARSWYSNALLARGRIDESLAQLEQARALDPLSMPIAYGIAQAHYYGRRWEDGLRSVERVMELSPGFSFGLLLKGKLLKGAGRIEEARRLFAQLGDSLELALLLPPDKRTRDVERLLAKIAPADQRKAQFWIATMYAQIGKADSAFAWIDRAYAAHQSDLASIRTDPMLDPVRGDPRYFAKLAQLGLGGDDGSARGAGGETR